MDLKKLKSDYAKLEKKYGLPKFEKLNESFEIDKIERETDFVLREVRKVIMDKIIGYKRFMEMMISPTNVPPMFTLFIKEVKANEKKIIESSYKKLVDLEMGSFKLEIDYSEKEEAELINLVFDTWNKLKPDLKIVVEMMERNWSAASKKKEKRYFG